MPNSRLPNLKILELKKDLAIFELTETDVSMANSLRRIMIAEVPTMCIDKVEFEDNNSALQDEFIAHRLGLIPLRSKIPMKDWNYIHACDCIGDGNCNSCSVSTIFLVQATIIHPIILKNLVQRIPAFVSAQPSK